MIRGTGIEIIALQDVQRWGEEEVRRQIWTPDELDYCDAQRSPLLRLAARYAAKKAILSALVSSCTCGVLVPIRRRRTPQVRRWSHIRAQRKEAQYGRHAQRRRSRRYHHQYLHRPTGA